MSAEQQAAPIFQPFKRIDPRGVPPMDAWEVLDFAATVADVANGVSTLLQLIEADHLERGFEDGQPLLSDHHRGSLQRLAIASMHSLSVGAEGLIAHAEKCRKASGG